jgi:hypothetical protein
VGTAAWVVDKRGSGVGLAVAGALTLWLLLGDSLHDKTAFSIINPSFNFQHALIHTSAVVGRRLGIGAIDARITLAVFAAVFLAGAAVVRRRASTRVALLAVTLPLLTYGVVATGYSMNKVTQALAGTPASHPHELTWIDKAVGPEADVGLMLASNGSLVNTWYTWWQPYFWNKSVKHAFILPGTDPYSQGYVGPLTPDLASGRLLGLDGVQYLVMLHADTRFGLPARPVNPGGELTIVPAPTNRLLYGTRGVSDAGALAWAGHPLVRVFNPTSSRVNDHVTLVVVVSGPVTGCPCTLSAGPGQASAPVANLAGGASQTVRLRTRATIAPSGHVDLPLTLEGSGTGAVSPAATLAAVDVGQA